jgi:3-hydroxyisobutyrate dehydrogenase
MTKQNIAFFGLGTMGAGMARRLLAAGFLVTIYNRSADKAAEFAREGAVVARSPRDAARRADIVVSMVVDDEASRGMWLGDDGALSSVPLGAVLIESSTLSVEWVRKLAGAAKEHDCELLDAPVTGSKPQAAAGELCFLVGGADDALDKARPVLEAMSRAIVHVGPTGSGALLKLINNFLCGVQAASLAEGMAMIEKGGLDREKAIEILTGGAPGSPIIKTLSARMAARDYSPNFSLRLMAKDLMYAAAQGKGFGIDSAMAGAALEVFQAAITDGEGERDLSAVVEQFRAK